MELLVGGGILSLVIFCFAIGGVMALPLIWFHCGHISRKLDKTNKLLSQINGLSITAK